MKIKPEQITNAKLYVELEGKPYLVKLPLDKMKILIGIIPALTDTLELQELPEVSFKEEE